MFSRRHPYLFFVLVSISTTAVAMISMSFLFVFAFRGSDFSNVIEKSKEHVGVIEINGVISDSKIINGHLKRFRENDLTKAIVIRINSPGGSVSPSQEIFKEVRKTAAVKKVVASMGAVAASGGYYVAAGTDGIIASPGTITGSIGVIMGFTNFRALLDKIGLAPVVIKSGEYKDIGSPVRKMTKKEEDILQNFIDQVHRQFITAIVESRGMEQAEVKELADGRIFSGEEAKRLGLIDRLGNFEDAVEWAGRMGGIKGEISTVYAGKKKFSLLKELADSSIGKLAHHIYSSHLYAGYLYQP